MLQNNSGIFSFAEALFALKLAAIEAKPGFNSIY